MIYIIATALAAAALAALWWAVDAHTTRSNKRDNEDE